MLPLPLLLVSLPVAASAGAAISAANRGDRRGVYLFKPLTTVIILALTLLLGAPAHRSYQAAIALGLVFSLAGDVFLMLPGDRFVAGLAAFLLAQATYIAAFSLGTGLSFSQLPLALPFAAVGFGVLAYLWPKLGGLKAPVTVYVTVIVAMVWRAAVRASSGAVPPFSGYVALGGACTFLVSDSTLAINRFRRPLRDAEAAVLSTYWAAQFLIALSVRGW